MAKPDYKRLYTEEDGEETPLQHDPKYWTSTSVVKHSIINVIVFACGILLGVFFTKSRLSNPAGHPSQYSLVPCKYAGTTD